MLLSLDSVNPWADSSLPIDITSPSQSADTTTPAASSNNWLDNIGSFINSAGKLVVNGAETVVAATQKLNAVQSTLEDTAKAQPETAPKVVTGAPATPAPSWLMPAVAVGLVIVGIFVARKMR